MSRRFSRRAVRFGGASILTISAPTGLAGLELWLRADLGTTIATGVSQWNDQSGKGDANRNVTQAVGAAQPTLNASDAAYNNKSTLSFASASSQVLNPVGAWSAALAVPYTIFVVGNGDGTVAAEGYVGDASNAVQLVNRNGGAGINAYAGAFLNAGQADTAAPVIVGAIFGASGSVYQSAKTAKVAGTTGTNSLSRLLVGADSAGHFLNGKVAEVVVYSRALSATEIGALLTYFGNRYAITVGS